MHFYDVINSTRAELLHFTPFSLKAAVAEANVSKQQVALHRGSSFLIELDNSGAKTRVIIYVAALKTQTVASTGKYENL